MKRHESIGLGLPSSGGRRSAALPWLLAGLLCALSACAPLPPLANGQGTGQAAAHVATPARDDVMVLLHYARELRGLSGKPLSDELERQRLLWQTDQGELQTLRHALVASQPASGVQQHKRALQLFEGLLPAADERYSDLQILAALWRQELLERRRLDEQAAQAAQRLREEQKRNEELGQRVQALQEKLDALVAIERRLIRRTGRAGGQP